MTDIRMKIDGNEVVAAEGTTVLVAARGAGVSIPTLCHHDELQPYGGCRLCIVEAESNGGRSIVASDGSVYVVGATRGDPPTAAVVHVAADGVLTSATLSAARRGAAAAWVEGRGLVVVAGNASAAGVELLADGAKAFVPLAFTADATVGAAVVALDGSRADQPLEPPPDFNEHGAAILRGLGLSDAEIEAWHRHNESLSG